MIECIQNISDYGGLVNKMPIYSTFSFYFILASIGLPGTSGFIGEFLILIGAFKYNYLIALFAATGVIFICVLRTLDVQSEVFWQNF